MKPKRITTNPAPFHYKENHMAEAQFNKQLTKEERIITAKPQGVKILKKIEKDRIVDLQKLDNSRLPQFVKIKFYLMEKLYIIYDSL